MSDDASHHSDGQLDDLFDSTRMSFGDHLEELRARLLLGLAGVFVAVLVSLAFGRGVLEILYRPLLVVQAANKIAPSLQVLSPTTGFTSYLKIAVLTGLIVSMPWLLFQIWQFVASGLYPKERRFVRRLVPLSIVLFATGVVFLYFVVLPVVLHFLIRFNKGYDAVDLTPTVIERVLLGQGDDGAEEASDGNTSSSDGAQSSSVLNIPTRRSDPKDPATGDLWFNLSTGRLMLQTEDGVMSKLLDRGAVGATMQSQFAIDFYVSFVLMLALAFGLAFETPIVVCFLGRTGIVPIPVMAQGRRYVLLGIVVLAAMLTPPDVISQLLLAGPMYLLFEGGLLIARLITPSSDS